MESEESGGERRRADAAPKGEELDDRQLEDRQLDELDESGGRSPRCLAQQRSLAATLTRPAGPLPPVATLLTAASRVAWPCTGPRMIAGGASKDQQDTAISPTSTPFVVERLHVFWGVGSRIGMGSGGSGTTTKPSILQSQRRCTGRVAADDTRWPEGT